MRTVDDAARCIEKLNGLSLHGRNIRVDYSATQKPHSSTPGQYMGAKRPVRKSSLSHMNCNAILSSYRAGDDRYGRGRYDDRRGGYGDRRHDDRRDYYGSGSSRHDDRDGGYRQVGFCSATGSSTDKLLLFLKTESLTVLVGLVTLMKVAAGEMITATINTTSKTSMPTMIMIGEGKQMSDNVTRADYYPQFPTKQILRFSCSFYCCPRPRST